MLLAQPDFAMYHARASGRDGVIPFDASFDEAARHRRQLQDGLRGALAGGELIARAVIAMAKKPDLRVIAEGVENEEQLEAQGFYLSEPLSPEAVAALPRTGLLPRGYAGSRRSEIAAPDRR